MRELRYEAASGAVIELEDVRSALAGQALDLRGSEWSYTLAQSSAYGMTRRARSAKVDVTFTRLPAADEALGAFDADVAAGTPGTLVADGKWRQRAYVLAADPKHASLRDCTVELTVALLDGRWHRLTSVTVIPSAAMAGGTDLPSDMPLDLGLASQSPRRLLVASMPSLVAARIWGPCHEPSVTLVGPGGAARRYGFTGDVADGHSVALDPLGRGIGRVAWAEDAIGNRTSAFGRLVRGGGADPLGELPRGTYEVTSDATAIVTLVELSGGVPWS